MGEAKHTPGPWTHCQEDNFITTRDGRGLLEWQARSLHVTPEERDANARLIAAAPDLLKACRQALAALKGREHDQFLRDAIAKATGTAP